MTNAEFAEYFKNRTKKFALNIIKSFQKLPNVDKPQPNRLNFRNWKLENGNGD